MSTKKTLSIDVFALTDCGYAKEQNEDAMLVSEDSLLIGVADGMGGEPYGEVASALAVKAMEDMYRKEPPNLQAGEDHAEWMERAFDFANESIYRHAEQDTSKFGMGTTLVAALIGEDGATIGNIGDSRAILISGKWANTITRDHANYDELRITEGHRKRSGPGGLTRRLGGDFSVQTDIFSIAIPAGATLLLCTDGLHGVLALDEIIAIVNDNAEAEDCCHELVQAALEYGGPDNVSVIVWRRLKP
jgi:PPM family protein phosphatase